MKRLVCILLLIALSATAAITNVLTLRITNGVAHLQWKAARPLRLDEQYRIFTTTNFNSCFETIYDSIGRSLDIPLTADTQLFCWLEIVARDGFAAPDFEDPKGVYSASPIIIDASQTTRVTR